MGKNNGMPVIPSELVTAQLERKRAFAEQFVELSARLGRDHGIGAMAFRRVFPERERAFSPETLYVKASRLLADPAVQSHIAWLREGNRKRHQATADRIIEELERIAFYDPLDAVRFDEDGNILLDLENMPPEQRSAIASIEINEVWGWEGKGEERVRTVVGQKIKIRYHDKNMALQTLARALGMLRDKVDVTLTLEDIDKAIERVERQLTQPGQLTGHA